MHMYMYMCMYMHVYMYMYVLLPLHDAHLLAAQHRVQVEHGLVGVVVALLRI